MEAPKERSIKQNQQIWDPNLYQEKHQYVYQYGEELIGLLDPKEHESVLDIGCGAGNLTQRLREKSRYVLGFDSSAEMIRQAHANESKIDYVVADARRFSFARLFDAAFSNAALHWVHEADAVLACLYSALKPGGRFVAEFGGAGNVHQIVYGLVDVLCDMGIGAVDPSSIYYFPRLDEYATKLHEQGFETTAAWLFDRLTKLDGGEIGLRNWVRMFGNAFIQNIPEREQSEMFEKLEQRLKARLFHDGDWYADYRRLRVVAVRR